MPTQTKSSFLALFVFVAAAFAGNPVPLLVPPVGGTPLNLGGRAATLNIRGDGFGKGTVVNWNGSPLVTTYVNSQELQAAVPAANLANPGTAAITAVNPAPGGGTSNTLFVSIARPVFSNAMTPSATSPTNTGPLAMVTGDFNHDGKLDVITGNESGNGISVLFGNGDGTFQAPVNYPGVAGQSVWALATGDFNGDGILDLAVVSDNNAATGYVYIMFGNADGTFQPPSPELSVGDAPQGIAAGDFNRDGKFDLAVSSSDTGTLSIFLGHGDGTFGSRTDYSAGSFPTQVVLGDINGDGIIDIAVLDLLGQVVTLLGNGDGTFTVSQFLPTSNSPQSLAAGYLNGAYLDLVVGNSETESVSVFLGSGRGSFQPRVDYNAGSGVLGLVLGDFNNDGVLDVAAATDSGLSILLGGYGGGSLQPALSYPVANSSAQALVAGDFNQDGRLDVVFANYTGASVTTMLQTTLATTPASLTYQFQTVGTSSLAQSIVVKNIDGGDISLGTIAIGGADPSDFTVSSDNCPASLTPAQTCQVKVKFTPTLGGERTASLLIANNTLNVSQPIPLTGYGTIVSLSPSKLDFGTETVGQTSPPMTSTLKNVGTVTLNIFKISIGGPNKTDFAETNTCGATLAPGAACSFSVTFTPSAKDSRTASVTINDDGDNGAGNTQSIALSGTGG